MAEWEINRPLGQCSGSGEDIETGQDYFATLVQTDEGLKRRDFSVAYWNENKPEVFCYWKTKLASPDEKKQIFIDDEMLMAFFERLAEETDEEKIKFRFVLTLILMRKRRLKYESSRLEDDKEIWSLRIAGTKDNAEVINPHLEEQQIEQLSSQLGQILQVDLQNSEQ
jgi:hypothetical protein